MDRSDDSPAALWCGLLYRCQAQPAPDSRSNRMPTHKMVFFFRMVLTVNSFLPELTCDPDVDACAHDRQLTGTHPCERYSHIGFHPQVPDLTQALFESRAQVYNRKWVLGRFFYVPGAGARPGGAAAVILVTIGIFLTGHQVGGEPRNREPFCFCARVESIPHV